MKISAFTYFSEILRNFRRRVLKDRLRHGLLLLFILNALYFLLVIPAEAIWYLAPEIKSVLIRIPLLNILALIPFLGYLRQAFRRHRTEEDEALLLRIGNTDTEIRDKLLNHYQLSGRDEELADYAVAGFMKKYPVRHFGNAYSFSSIRKKTKMALLLLFFLLLEIILLTPAFGRLFHPRLEYQPEQLYSIEFRMRDTTVFAYDSLQVYIYSRAPEHFPVVLFRHEQDQLIPVDPEHIRGSLYLLDLPRLRESAEYIVMLRRPHLFYPRKYPARDTLRIGVAERPRIRRLDFVITPPEYSGIPAASYQGNVERIRCLPGSQIRIEALLSDSAGASFMLLNRDTMKMRSRAFSNTLTFTARKPGKITLMYFNRSGTGIREALSYRLEIEEDVPPQIDLIRPETSEELVLNESLRLPYMANLRDDYGISAFRVRYQVHSQYGSESGNHIETLNLPFEDSSRVQTVLGSWEIPVFISPGSALQYYFEAADNDTVRGPKITRTKTLFARFPTLADLFEQQDDKEQMLREGLEEELQNSARIAEDIKKIRQEMLREGEMDWQNKSALEESLNTLEKSQESLQKLQESLEEQKRFMEEHTLFDKDVLDRFGQLQDLMNELIDDELWNMLQEIREKLRRNESSGMEEILENFSEKAKQFEQSLDRMLEIFKRIRQEQRLEELSERIKKNLRSQEQLLEKKDLMSAQELAEREEAIAKDTKDWEERAKDSAELFEQEDREAFDEFLEKMDSLSAAGKLQEAAQQFRMSKLTAGKQNAEASGESMQKLSQDFSQMAASMMQRQREDIGSNFKALLQKSIYLSNEQEEALQFSEGIDIASPLLHTFTSREGTLLEFALDMNKQLLSLSEKTFLVDKSLGIAMGMVIGNLQSGIRLIEEANFNAGHQNIKKSFSAMNRLSRLLLERSEMLEQQQGNASGMEFYLQQLQQMAGQQESLNQGMPQPGMNGSPGSGMMDELARLAARQQALRRSLKQIQQGVSDGDGGRRLTGDLEQIAADMQKVIDEMRENQVDRRTIMRQQQIVQRLLDASRSATSRDFKKERESKPGTFIQRENPLGLPEGLGENGSMLESLRRAVRESKLTPAEKREMERYLELLMEEYQVPEIEQ